MAPLAPRQLLRSERGAELIEMAVVLPLLLLLIMSIVDFGFMFQRYVVLTNAAMEGARVATLPGYTNADAIARVQAYAANGGINGAVDAVVVPVQLPGAGGGTWPGRQVTVTHAYPFQYVRPMMVLFGNSMGTATLTARATMRLQINP